MKIFLTELIDVEFLQKFQNAFASCLDVACVIIDFSGQITKPSNFINLNKKKSKKNIFNIEWKEINLDQNEILIFEDDFGLINFVAPIKIAGKHIASLLVGQVSAKEFDETFLTNIAIKKRINPNEYLEAFKKIKIVSLEEIKKITGLLKIVVTAISEIAEKKLDANQCHGREDLTRKIVKSILDFSNIEEIFDIVCNIFFEVFGVERTVIIEYPNENNFKDFHIKKEYNVKKNLKKNKEPLERTSVLVFSGFVLLNSKKPLIINNVEKSETPSFFREFYKNLEVKSLACFPVILKNHLWGYLSLATISEYKNWKEEEIIAIESIVNQIAIAINQFQLYKKEKELLEREMLLKEINQIAHKSSDYKKNIVEMAATYFDADRCVFCEYDHETHKFLPFTIEKLKSSDIPSILGYDSETTTPEFAIRAHNKKDVLTKDVQKTLARGKNLLKNYKSIHTIAKDGVKSDYGLVIEYKGKLLGLLIIQFIKEKKSLSKQEMEFVKAIKNQAGSVLYQAEISKESEQIAENENILRKIMLSSVSNYTYEQMIKSLVTETGKYFNADRCFYIEIDIETGQNLPVKESEEYLSSPDITSHINWIPKKKETGGFIKRLIRDKEIITCDDISKEKLPLPFKKMLEKLNVKSYLIVNVYYGEEIYGTLVLHYVKNFKHFTKKDIYMAEAIATQAAIIINQSKIYKKQKSSSEKVSLLQQITEAIKLSSDIEEIKQKIVNEIGKAFNADRCFFREYDLAEGIFLEVNAEYLSSDKIESIKGVVPNQKNLKFLKDEIQRKPNSIIQITQSNTANIKNVDFKKYLEKYNVKASFLIPIWDKEKNLTFFTLQYKKRTALLQKEEKNLLQTLAKQISIAFDQSNLYKETKQQTKREIINQNIIETIRGSLDLQAILSEVCHELFKIFDVQRILIANADFKYSAEVTSREEVVKFKKIDRSITYKLVEYWTKEIKKTKAIKIIDNMEKADMPKEIKEIYIKLGVKSLIFVPIQSKEKIWGAMYLSTTDKYHIWTENEKRFLLSISNQLDTGIKKAELYEEQIKAANKERILKDIIADIKLTRNLKEAYERLLKKLSQIFNLNRTLFLESSKIRPEELNIKYEYVLNKKNLATNHFVFPQVCIDEFLNLIHNLQPLILDDVAICHPEETTIFFRKYKISSMMAFPLVKYNKEIKVLGFIVLCAEEVHRWTNEEIDLMKAISDSVVSIIWEIAKFVETEELKDSFVSTLAHDFQVPLIGERTAIEYMLEYSDIDLGENRKILEEILENNHNIIELLNKSVDIYNYESGKKKLDLAPYSIDSILNEVILISQEFAQAKKIKIDFKKFDFELRIEADKKELLKVFKVLLDNAIEHSIEEADVRLEYYLQNQYIIISFQNIGNPIPPEIQEKIFNRYEMAQAIERKIGAGTGLFLAKKIVEAHKGNIWFKTYKDFGTIFYISLPYLK